MKKKRFILLSLIFILLSVSCSNNTNQNNTDNTNNTNVTNTKKDTIDFNILEMNDIHGNISNDSSSSLAKASYLVNEIRNEDDYDNTILIGNGDMFQGTGLVRINEGKVLIDCMNFMNFDCLGIGNHEFDWGLDTILNYFDGNDSNGEANFPLINSNIYKNKKLVGNDINKVVPSFEIEKEGVKIGILSYIGDIMNSINYNMVAGYDFNTNFEKLVLNQGIKLKDDGCDIIIVNIHGGNASGIENYDPNNIIANLKYKGKYLVDAVINGHTHTKQYGKIVRKNGVNLPVIQSSGNLDCFGRIDLRYNKSLKAVTSFNVNHVDVSSSNNNDLTIFNYLNDFCNLNNDVLNEVYCFNSNYVYRSSLYSFGTNCILRRTDADFAIINKGAYRCDLAPGNITYQTVYQLNPFDNHIIIVNILGKDLKKFMSDYDSYEYCGCKNIDYYYAEDYEEYKLAILDYIYFNNYFLGYRKEIYIDSNVILRDLLIEEFKKYKNTGFSLG